MAKKCDLCGRGATKGASRSHSKVKTLKKQNINLQTKEIDGTKFKFCTACLRTMNKPKRVKTPRKPVAQAVKKVKKIKKTVKK